MIIASSPSMRLWPFLTSRGVKVPARSRGTSISKEPTSESIVFVLAPLLALPRAAGVGRPPLS